MMRRGRRAAGPALLAVLLAWDAIALGTAAAQAKEEPKREKGTRQLWDEEFLASRPQAAQPAAPKRRPPAATTGRPESFVGVTVWKLRAAAATDESRGVAFLSGADQRWVPERAEVGQGLAQGQRVRLSVEASRRGYLYVIDQETYADGSLGAPLLIFPTLRTRGGDNAVQPGRVVEIPDVQDQPPFFTVGGSRPDHVGERLLLLVTPTPLPGIEVGRNPLGLSRAQVQEWEKTWGAPARKLEMAGGAGRAYTPAEREAGENRMRFLTPDEPLPQTLYRVDKQPSDAILVPVTLQVAKRP